MTKFKRAICMFIACAITLAFVTGCALLETDVDYYNNMVVATVGADIKVNKGQLVSAYNSYGYQYNTQQGLTQEEAVEKTLNDLIDREIFTEMSIQAFSYKSMNASDKAAHIKSLRGKKGKDSLFYDALFEGEKAEVRKQAYDAINEYYLELQNKVREERKLEFKAPEEAEDPNLASAKPAMDPFKAFEATVTRNSSNTTFYIDYSNYENKKLVSASETWSPDIEQGGDSIVKTVKTEALSRLVRGLKNNEKGKKVGTSEAVLVQDIKFNNVSILTLEERAIVGREIGRMIEDYSKTVLCNRYQEIFDLGTDKPFDITAFASETEYKDAIQAAVNAGPTATGKAGDLANQAKEYYRSQVISQYNRYAKKIDTVEALHEKVVSGLSGIYWLPEEVAKNNFTVSHILIQYTDDQKAEFEKIKTEFSSGGTVTYENYQSRMNALAGNLKAPMRDEDGLEVKDKDGKVIYKTAIQIRDEIMDALGDNTYEYVQQIDGSVKKILKPDAVTGKSAEERSNIFRDFIYKYNQDPGMNNPEYEYVMGIKTDAEGKKVENSGMVKEFTAASLEMFGYKQVAKKENGKYVFDDSKNPVVTWERRDAVDSVGVPSSDGHGGWVKADAVKGSMTYDLVMSDYGAHIIMYTRDLSDFIYSYTQNIVNFSAFETALDQMMSQSSVKNYLYASLTSYGNEFGQVLYPEGKDAITAIAKTNFDLCVEKMKTPEFESDRAKKISVFKAKRVNAQADGKLVNPIKLYPGNYKDLIG